MAFLYYKNNPSRFNIAKLPDYMYSADIHKNIENNVKFDIIVYNFVKQDISNFTLK